MVFYCRDIESGKLGKEESIHCSRVLRAKVDQEITLFDGKGRVAIGILTSIGKHCEYEIISEETYKPENNHFTIAIAPPKKSTRFDFMIEKLVELGAQEIYLIQTKNSERNRINKERLYKQVVAACKQSLQFLLPTIHFEKSIKELEHINKQFYVCHCEDATKKASLKSLKLEDYRNGIFFIGPEGDFNLDEIEYFKTRGAQFIDLGEARLRTETAAIYVAASAKQSVNT